ncbi:MAG: sugar kinase [Burkholderiales bacterium]|nr:sugar kinase [Burkholderiales bacterium]
MPSVITLGETSVVFVARDLGRMRYCRDFTIRPGGAEATVAVGVSRLGFDAAWMSALGDDEPGHYLRSLIAGEGVDVSRVAMVRDQQTAIFLRERLPGGDARHFYYRKGSAFSHFEPSMLDEEFIASARFLHLTGITPALSDSCDATCWRALEVARAHGTKVTFDPNVRLSLWSREEARQRLQRYLTAADYVFPGMEDMRMMFGAIDRSEALKIMIDLGCRRFALKDGKQDVLVHEDGLTVSLPVHHVEHPADLMGAGDAFAAGCLAGLLRGLPLTEAARVGNAVAEFAIQLPGNIESMPTWSEVERLMAGAEDWKR